MERVIYMLHKDSTPTPMSYKRASHLLNPLRKFVLSPTKLANRLLLRSNADVLELGCYSEEVAQRIPFGKLTLVDIQQEMLDMAKGRIDSLGLSNINYVKADATALPFENDTYDVIFLIAMLGEVPDQEKCIYELSRVLRTGGLLSVSEQSRDPHFITIEKINNLIGNAFRFKNLLGIATTIRLISESRHYNLSCPLCFLYSYFR